MQVLIIKEDHESLTRMDLIQDSHIVAEKLDNHNYWVTKNRFEEPGILMDKEAFESMYLSYGDGYVQVIDKTI